MLDAPISELTMCDNVDAAKDLVDAGTLFKYTLSASGHVKVDIRWTRSLSSLLSPR